MQAQGESLCGEMALLSLDFPSICITTFYITRMSTIDVWECAAIPMLLG